MPLANGYTIVENGQENGSWVVSVRIDDPDSTSKYEVAFAIQATEEAADSYAENDNDYGADGFTGENGTDKNEGTAADPHISEGVTGYRTNEEATAEITWDGGSDSITYHHPVLTIDTVTNKPTVSGEKWVEKDGSGSYTLHLAATPVDGDTTTNIPGSTTEATGADVVLVLDRSSSMSNIFSSMKTAANEFARILLQQEEGKTKDNRVAVVYFGSDLQHSSNGFTSRYDTALGYSYLGRYSSTVSNEGTNYEAGLNEAENLLNSRSAAEKAQRKPYVIFLTDGAPTLYANGSGSGSCTDQTTLLRSLVAGIDLKNDVEGVTIYTVGYNLSNDTSAENFLKPGTTQYYYDDPGIVFDDEDAYLFDATTSKYRETGGWSQRWKDVTGYDKYFNSNYVAPWTAYYPASSATSGEGSISQVFEDLAGQIQEGSTTSSAIEVTSLTITDTLSQWVEPKNVSSGEITDLTVYQDGRKITRGYSVLKNGQENGSWVVSVRIDNPDSKSEYQIAFAIKPSRDAVSDYIEYGYDYGPNSNIGQTGTDKNEGTEQDPHISEGVIGYRTNEEATAEILWEDGSESIPYKHPVITIDVTPIGSVTIDKEIDTRWAPNGDPIFLYRLERLSDDGTEVLATWYDYIRFTPQGASAGWGYTNWTALGNHQQITFGNLELGKYRLTELGALRYEFDNARDDQSLIPAESEAKGTVTVNGNSVTFEVSMDALDFGVKYSNREKDMPNVFTHTDVVKNRINIVFPAA